MSLYTPDWQQYYQDSGALIIYKTFVRNNCVDFLKVNAKCSRCIFLPFVLYLDLFACFLFTETSSFFALHVDMSDFRLDL